MHDYVRNRALEVSKYIVDYNATVRQAAQKFGISKSTVHVDATKRIGEIDKNMAELTRKVIDLNKAERYARGGRAVQKIYREKAV
jgi:putative DeoR family transcriptional regulator (stage III sporulation protein D)